MNLSDQTGYPNITSDPTRRIEEQAIEEMRPIDDCIAYLRRYGHQRPEVLAYACFGIGFILGWKLKPW